MDLRADGRLKKSGVFFPRVDGVAVSRGICVSGSYHCPPRGKLQLAVDHQPTQPEKPH